MPELASLLAPLLAEPRRSAVVSDIDGTLAPIVPTPEEARVPPRALAALEALCGRYALVGLATAMLIFSVVQLTQLPGPPT